MTLPAAWLWKPHSFPPPRRWPGCPPPGMPSRLWNLALTPDALHGERGRVHQSPHGGWGARWSQSTAPCESGQFRPIVPSPNPYSKRVSEKRGKGRKREGEGNSGRNTGGRGRGVCRGMGPGGPRNEPRWGSTALSPALRGPSWVRPPGSRPAASEGPMRPPRNSRLITTRGGAGSSARPHRPAPRLGPAPPCPRSLRKKRSGRIGGDGPRIYA